MKQEYKYTVVNVGPEIVPVLEEKDEALVGSYKVGTVSPFNPDESRLDVIVRDLEGNVLETHQDVLDYAVRGVDQGATRVNQLEVDPTSFMKDRTFLGDVIVEYKAFDSTFSRKADLYILDISSDRTELRIKSTNLSSRELRYYSNLLQNKLNNQSYFYGAFLEVEGIQVPIVNILTEALDSDTVVALKLYSALPTEIEVKTRIQVLESLGESSRFRVHRELVVVPEELPVLKGPNFGVEVESSTIATDYKNYTELLSQKSWESSKELYTTFKDAIQHTSVDYEDFSDFIHFSSAFERLENAKYKFEKIFDYQVSLVESRSAGKQDDVVRIQGLINGLIENFDHYENYLWFESGSRAWPKKIDPETGVTARPFVNVDHADDLGEEEGYEKWYEELATLAEGYDNNNKDILISTIPAAIREDVDHNEPYLMFVHMIGQHFDDLWIYARAIVDRYNGDNRMEFGISKELVKDALAAFGVDLYETNQNLTAFFDLCKPDGTYAWGEELEGKNSIKSFIRVDTEEIDEDRRVKGWIEQPVVRENYTREVYKRIYHNIPALLKMKGTSRGLRVLLNCFGIPNDILKFRVQGGTDFTEKPFFGPEETVNIFDEDIDSSGNVESPAESKKIRLGNRDKHILEYRVVDRTGSFYTSSVLSRYVSATSSRSTLTDDSHKVEVGFDLNEAANRFFEKNVEDFTVDDIIGDPRNKENQYGDVWKSLREKLLDGIVTEDSRFRAPAAIIRLVRYFDSTFFRMLKDFLPARASIDSGVIVKDNLLHRNRWKGTALTWTELTKSGSVSGSTAEGSHGGVYPNKKENPYITGDEIYTSTGDRWKVKKIPSGSREFNGELSGSQIKVTDGDLSKYNKHRKDLQPENDFRYNFWFLDLPDPPFCRAKAASDYVCEYWKFEAVSASVSGTLANIPNVGLAANKVRHVFAETGSVNTSSVYESHRTNKAFYDDGTTFMGWYVSGTYPYSRNNYRNRGKRALTPGRVLNLDPYISGSIYYFKAWYNRDAEVQKTLWMEQLRPEPDWVHYYYPDNDLLVAWKLLDRGANPRVANTEATSSVISTLGGIKVKFRIKNGSTEADYELVLPDEVTFGTNDSYYWVQGFTETGSISNYGIQQIGDYVGPFSPTYNTVVDATWFDNYDDWVDFTGSWSGSWLWPITVAADQTEISETPYRDENGYWK